MKINVEGKKRTFLDIDLLTQWDNSIYQRVIQPEKVEIKGLEPGPPGSWDSGLTTIWGTVLKENGVFKMWV